MNEKRIATAEEKEVLKLSVRAGEIRLKVAFAGFRKVGTPRETATLTATPDEKRYFLFTAKVLPSIPIVTPQGVYGLGRDVFSLREVDSTEFAVVSRTKTE